MWGNVCFFHIEIDEIFAQNPHSSLLHYHHILSNSFFFNNRREKNMKTHRMAHNFHIFLSLFLILIWIMDVFDLFERNGTHLCIGVESLLHQKRRDLSIIRCIQEQEKLKFLRFSSFFHCCLLFHIISMEKRRKITKACNEINFFILRVNFEIYP